MAHLLAFFVTGGIVLKFFAWIGKTIFIKGLILPFQFAVLGVVLVTRIAIITMLFTLAIDIFNAIHSFFDLFNNLNINNPEVFDVPFKILHNLGLFQAIQEHLPLFSLVLLTFFIVVLSKITLETMTLIARELFQIGLLTSR